MKAFFIKFPRKLSRFSRLEADIELMAVWDFIKKYRPLQGPYFVFVFV